MEYYSAIKNVLRTILCLGIVLVENLRSKAKGIRGKICYFVVVVVVVVFLVREKRILKWGVRKFGSYPSSAVSFPQPSFHFRAHFLIPKINFEEV